jgi:cytoskeletal protein RodZ
MGLDQIGQKLKAAREGQGLSLSQIYERTKIPTNHLQSIDEGQMDELPEPVYVAGFIKRYADCVGLNGQSLSDEYRRQNNNNGSNGGNNGDSGWGSRLIAQPMVSAPPFSTRSALDVRPPNVFKQGLFYAVLIVIVLGCFSFLFAWQSNYQLNLQSDPANQLLKRDYRGALSGAQPQTVGTTIAAPTEAQAPGASTTDPTQPAAEAAIAISASKHVWLNVTAVGSGQSLYEGYMESGERKDFKDAQGIRVRAGNGASVSVEFQGKSETLGVAGKVAEKSFMSKSAATAAVPDPKAQAAAAAALKAASVKKTVKPKVASDTATRKHSRASDDGARGDSAARAPIDVPYRYTESPND